jgi:hypothetical protein
VSETDRFCDSHRSPAAKAAIDVGDPCPQSMSHNHRCHWVVRPPVALDGYGEACVSRTCGCIGAASTPAVVRDFAGRGQASERVGRPPSVVRCRVDNQRPDGGRRPRRSPCQLAGRPGGAAGPGRGPGGAAPTRQGVRAGLLADLPGKDCWRIAEHAGQASPGRDAAPAGPGGVDADGSATTSATTSSSTSAAQQRCWSSTRPGDPKKGHHHGRRQAPGRRHRRPRRRRPGRGLPRRRRQQRPRRHRPGAVPAPVRVDDPGRCRAAGVPDQVGSPPSQPSPPDGHARAWRRVPAAWVTGDEADGADPRGLRAELEARGSARCWRSPVATPFPRRRHHRADALLGRVPARACQQASRGKGAKATAATAGRCSA